VRAAIHRAEASDRLLRALRAELRGG